MIKNCTPIRIDRTKIAFGLTSPVDGRMTIHIFPRNGTLFIASILACTFVFCEIGYAEPALVKTTVAYKEVDGHRIPADIHRLNDDVIRPVIVNIHGGALIMGHRDLDTSELRDFLAEDPDYMYFDL